MPTDAGVNVMLFPLFVTVATRGSLLVTVPNVPLSEHTTLKLFVSGYAVRPLVTVVPPSLNVVLPAAFDVVTATVALAASYCPVCSLLIVMVALPYPVRVTVALVLPLPNATVATSVSLDVTLFVPLHVPQSMLLIEPVVLGYVIVKLAGLRVIVQVPRFTVNAYSALQLLYKLVSALVTVIVLVPADTGVMVTVPLLILAVATPVALDDTLNVPPLLLLAVKLPVLGYVIVPLVGLNVTVQEPLFTVNAYVALALS